MSDTTRAHDTDGKEMHAQEAGWYNEFYGAMGRFQLAPWHRCLIPVLIPELRAETRIVELGCGQGQVLRLLTQMSPVREENIYGVDLSSVAVAFTQKELPKAHISTQDIYQLNYPAEQFDVCVMLETIEHLEEPVAGLKRIASVMKTGGLLYISFPNYAHLPWLLARVLAEKLNRPNWVVLQPVDKIYTTWAVERLAEQAGFRLESGTGSNYGPPIFHPLENEWMTRGLNRLGLWRFSYHPVLKFRKTG